jgi:DNA polymerase III psi subunit
MQRPSSGWFIENAARVRLIAQSSQAIFLVLLNLRRALVLSAIMLLPPMTLQADDSKVHLLDSNKNVKQLTTEMVREIFFMRLSSWPDGSPIHVFVLPDNHPLHVRFAKEILGVYPFQLRSAWDRLVFSGTGVSPTTVESEEEMRARIESTPGSIGYTDKK